MLSHCKSVDRPEIFPILVRVWSMYSLLLCLHLLQDPMPPGTFVTKEENQIVHNTIYGSHRIYRSGLSGE